MEPQTGGVTMTNRDALIMSLRIMVPDENECYDALCESPFEDTSTPESIIAYHVACPHYAGDENLPCNGLNYPWSTLDVCGPCKLAWLDEEMAE